VVAAIPATTVTGLPMGFAPSMKVTVPVAAAGVTRALSITPCPGVDEGGVAERTTLVLALLTCTPTGVELLVLNVVSPE